VGKVLELKGSGRAFIDFGRFRAMADVGFPIRRGEVIHVKVMEKGVPLRLSLCGPEPGITGEPGKNVARGDFPSRHLLKEFQSQIRQLLPAADPAGKGEPSLKEFNNAVRNLMTHFRPIDMGKHAAQIAGQLKSVMEDSGIFYEKKIEKIIKQLMQVKKELSSRDLRDSPEVRQIANKDLKPNLAVLREFLAGKDPMLKTLDAKDWEGLRKTVEKLLTEITARQNDTGTKPLRSEPVQVYTYLLPMKDLQQEAKVKVYYSKKNRSKPKNEFRVSVLLTMERIGEIRTDFFLMDKSLTIDFLVSEASIQEYLSHHLDELKQLLDDYFKTLSVNVAVSEKKIAEFDFEDLVPLSSGLIDVKV